MTARRPATLLLDYAPSGGFMADLDALLDEVTDGPALFRPFTGLATVAGVVGRQVVFDFGAFEVPPNVYICLLAPSSFMHKSTQVGISKRLVRAVRPDVLLPDDFTPERMIELLEAQPERLMVCPEFAGFMARAGRDYNTGVRELFMELYDAPDTFKRDLRSKTVTVDHPVLNIFAASATSWFADQLKGGDLRSGFLNRFNFVLAEADAKTKSFPIPPPPSPGHWQRLIDRLTRIADVKGKADIGQIARPFEAWYRDMEREALRCEAHVETLSAFYTRMSVTALKFAVLLEVARTQNLVVSNASLDEALVLVNYLRAVVQHLLQVEFSGSDGDGTLSKVARIIRSRPGATRKVLLQHAHIKSRDLSPILETLVERGDVYLDDKQYWPNEGGTVADG